VRQAALADITRLAAYTVDQDSQAAEELAKHGVKDLQTPDEILRAELDAPKTVAHAQKMTPPMEIAVRHYWQKK
jgi:hypothetical protein